MNCPKCGNPVTARKRNCETCGYDLSVLRRLRRLSNGFYNRGLEKAKVRDLTGAVLMLKKSLETYKLNIDARNLLGLVYYEMGETVSALSEWVISKNFQAKDNDADYFINLIQENPTKLEALNQSVRKYNIALDAAKQGSDDLAIIQLKKVVGLNPKFIKALQLLALLYMKNNEYKRATRYLQSILKLDVANTVALKYLSEINRLTVGEVTPETPYWSEDISGEDKKAHDKSLVPTYSYKEDKPNRMVFINLLLGVIIGIAVVYYLIVPTVEQNIREEYNSKQVDYSGELSAKSAKITQLEKSITTLEAQLQQQYTTIAELEGRVVPVEIKDVKYGTYFTAMRQYIEFIRLDSYSDEELLTVALALHDVETEGFENAEANTMLETARNDIYSLAERVTYKAGKKLYDEEKYEEAAETLLAAVDFSPESDTAMYYLGKSYQALTKYEEAAYYYRLMLEVCPNSTLKQYIPQRLREMGMDE